ncbi:MAG TPA: DUF992 domain-containing protein [Phenylobacterium sp.]|uniref:DUF992 domain-containing protein n=1 Tax=Phenylobacterium sp. TaxID=1871053 RepID=UPI002B4946DF|nr:DUF992 domain-containing protein [Phenylobacterium sp.]HKR90477.1 DUF992 domain-containing protein [Phenylobacterium sp.]
MKKLLSCMALCAALGVGLPAQAASGGGVNLGTLSCHVSSGWGLIFGSSRSLKCAFSGRGRIEDYDGNITRFGVDIGYQRSGVIIWNVFAPTGNLKPGALAGRYGGVTAGAAVGVGLGANALVGGSGNQIGLQPLSIQGKTGLNVAGGIAGLTLRFVPPKAGAEAPAKQETAPPAKTP